MTDDAKNNPRRAVEAPRPDLSPSSLEAEVRDPVDERIAALFDKLKAPLEVDPRPLVRVRARLDSVIRSRSERRSRLWIYAVAGSFLLLSSGAVIAARAWAPHWDAWTSLISRVQPRPTNEHAHQVVRVYGSGVPAQAPAAAAPSKVVPDVGPLVPAAAPRLPSLRPPTMAMAAVQSHALPDSEAALLETAVARLRRDHDAAGALRILDRYDGHFADASLRGEATRLRVDALLLMEDRAGALSLLERLTLSSGARDVELMLIRGELLAARGDCLQARADFDRVSSSSTVAALRARSSAGRAACERREGLPATAP